MSQFSPQFLHDIWHKRADLTSLSAKEWEDLVLLLRSEMLLARFAYFYQQQSAEFPRFVQWHLSNARKLARKQAKQVLLEATLLTPLCRAHSDSVVFLKGAAYTLLGGELAQGRVYSDIDLLVSKAGINSIEKDLVFRGWISKPLNDYDDYYYRQWVHEIPPLIHSNRGTVLDLHHNIVPPISGKAPNVDSLLSCVTETDDGLTVLSPAGLLLHSCVHLFFNEEQEHGYRDLVDIWLLLTRYKSPDFWQQLHEIIEHVGFKTEVILGLHYTAQFFEVDIPASLSRHQINSVRWSLLDFIYKRTLLPNHKTVKVSAQKLAIFMAWVRGHWCKMPIHILLWHFIAKGGRKLAEGLFGTHIFKKTVPQQQ
ncbi:hypothetical protein GTH32_17275 [Alteromonas sp. 345S023]|uniref:Nucleotidyltransferase family protein n=1 Tax=Alteromonas profundi TaxID=2696062 RepID=A0A7X5LP48_9ALTE|nr:nucleotidyltransferase family protein [Alteromonas profundi]NDV92922.1 hypothetical protein [Alteromonas profundi]